MVAGAWRALLRIKGGFGEALVDEPTLSLSYVVNPK